MSDTILNQHNLIAAIPLVTFTIILQFVEIDPTMKSIVIALFFSTFLVSAIWNYVNVDPLEVTYKKMAYDAIMEGDLQKLRKHPLWDKESPECDRKKFSKLQQYQNNFLLLAATEFSKNMEIVKFLVEEVGVDVNQQTNAGESALHRACTRNKVDIVRYLVEVRGANIEAKERGEKLMLTPMFRACHRNRYECADILLQNGAKIHFFMNQAPFDDQFWTDLKDETKNVILKHQKLRKMRIVMKINYFGRKMKKKEILTEELLEHDPAEVAKIQKYFPKDLLKLNKNVNREIM